MPQSLSSTLVHVVFSTKRRRPRIDEPIRDGPYAHLAIVARDRQCRCFGVGGMPDHVHLALRVHATQSLAKLIA